MTRMDGCVSRLAMYFSFLVILFKMHTLELVARPTTPNSSIHEIEVQPTTTELCLDHWFIVFSHQGGRCTSPNIYKRQSTI